MDDGRVRNIFLQTIEILQMAQSDTIELSETFFCKQSRSYGWAILLQLEQSGTTTFLQTVKIIRMCRSDTKRTVRNNFLQTIKIIWMGHPVAKETVQ